MSELVKRQHYVPRTYLKHFGETIKSESFIHALPKLEYDPKKIFKTNTKNVAVKNQLYTLKGDTIEEKMALEKFYSEELEQHYDKAYEILIDPKINKISDQDKELIISTIITMYYRTTNWLNSHNSLMERVFSKAYETCIQNKKSFFYLENKKVSIEDKSLVELISDYNNETQPLMVMTQLVTALKLISLRISRFDSLIVSKLDDNNSHLITSDNPVNVSNISHDYTIPFDPTNIMKLPLNSSHILMIMPYGEKDLRNNIFRNNLSEEVAYAQKISNNYQQMTGSEKFLFGSKDSLENYLSTKEETESPMSTEMIIKTQKGIEAIKKKMNEAGLI